MTAADYTLISGDKQGRKQKPTDRQAMFDPIAGKDVLVLPAAAVPGSSPPGIRAVEGVAQPNQASLPLQAWQVPLVDAGVTGAGGGTLIYTLPKGVLQVSVVVSLVISRVGTNLVAGAAVVGSVGTATAAADATLTGTEADLVASTAATLTAGVGSFQSPPTAASVLINNTGATAKLYLNFATNDAGSAGNDALSCTGTVTVTYLLLGDY
jgi:hypothetical protein